MQTYWGMDSDGIFYVIRQTEAKKKTQGIKESLMVVPLPGQQKCMVFFFSDFNYFQSDDRQVVNPMIMNAFLYDKVKLSRTEILAAFA